MARLRREGYVMISIVAERYNIHPQTLRLYEREGLIKPERTDGNTRLYGPETIKRLEMILRLTRDLGVNLAGVEVILNLQRRMRDDAGIEIDQLLDYIRQQVIDRRTGVEDRHKALVKAQTRQLQTLRSRK